MSGVDSISHEEGRNDKELAGNQKEEARFIRLKGPGRETALEKGLKYSSCRAIILSNL